MPLLGNPGWGALSVGQWAETGRLDGGNPMGPARMRGQRDPGLLLASSGLGLCVPGWARLDGGPDNRKSLEEQAVAEDFEHNNRKQP